MFDQPGTLRELVSWDYELRDGLQLETVIDRALMIATTPPKGPAFEQVCVAAGSYGERIENPADLSAAFARAFHAVNVEKRQALGNGGGG
jgi:thiamine pyrophosphate-dependent acetolactate synthase large subunit-like protein